MPRFLVVIDTPGIKQFVFGTDALAEIRGASALLDRLNRVETEERLQETLDTRVKMVFANGGTAQFVVECPNEGRVRDALAQFGAYCRAQTGGEVRPIAAVAEYGEETEASYRQALNNAFVELRLQRNLASGHATTPTVPLVLECASTSHLPAAGPFHWGGDTLLLSRASQLKRQESRGRLLGSLWSGWIDHLEIGAEHAETLRPGDATSIGRQCRRSGYIGLVYADGNAMGRLVQELTSPEVCAEFSQLVDSSVREACYRALGEVCESEITRARAAIKCGETPKKLPADILLVGGDDIVVVLPADRALQFALRATDAFERRTRERQSGLSPAARAFFADKGLGGHGLTISCGVAIAPARHPFYAVLDLAEKLLDSAKCGSSADPDRKEYWAPSFIDFHVVGGSGSQELGVIRERDYRVQTSYRRTLRPYRRERLERLGYATKQLQVARLPRSKLLDLFEAAMEPRPAKAQRRAQELFGRLRRRRDRDERRALSDSLGELGELDPFPWLRHDGNHATALADIVEAYDLFSFPEAT